MFMKQFFVLLVWACFVLPVSAQNVLHGVVTDAADGSPLPGASVMVEGTFQGVHTSSNGTFRFGNIAGPLVSLRISFVGFEPQTVEVDMSLQRNQPLAISLERSMLMSQEVIVQATRADSRTPSTHTNVSASEIAARNLGQDLPFLLSLTPSLITSSDAGAGIGYTWMNIRGSDNSRINVTLNGVPINDAESHGVWWVNMPDIASSTENIQIQRGVGTSTHGAAAFGATISLSTTGLNADPYAEIVSSGGSFNTLRNTANFGTGLMAQRWAFDGRLSRISSDGYIDRSFSDLKSFYLSGGYYGANTVVQAITFSGKETTYQAWNGVPGSMLESQRTFNPSGMYFDTEGNMRFYENETDNYQQDHYQLHVTHRLGLNWVANTSLHYTYGRGYYEQYRQNDRFSRYGLPNVVIDNQVFSRTDLVRQRWLDNHFYGLTWALDYSGRQGLNAVWGGGYNIYEGDHFGKIIWARLATGFDKNHRYYDNGAEKKDFNSFLKFNFELNPQLYFYLDQQYRHINYTFVGRAMVNNEVVNVDQTAVFHFWNPKTGFMWQMNEGQTLSLFAGMSNREPVRRDFTESSPDSRPRHETLRNVELGWRMNTSKTLLAANLYLMDYKDQLVLTGQINDVGGFSRTNIDRSYRVGVELEGAYRFSRLLGWSGNITLSQNKIREFVEFSDEYDADGNWLGEATHQQTYSNTDIAFSPSVVAASKLEIRPLPAFSVNLISKYVGKQYIDNTSNANRMLDPYLVNDLLFGWSVENGLFRQLELTFGIYNLLAEQYITNAWVYKGAVDGLVQTLDDGYFPQAGRHFLMGLRLKI